MCFPPKRKSLQHRTQYCSCHRVTEKIRNKRRSKAGDLLNKRSRCRSNKEYFVDLAAGRWCFRLFQRFPRFHRSPPFVKIRRRSAQPLRASLFGLFEILFPPSIHPSIHPPIRQILCSECVFLSDFSHGRFVLCVNCSVVWNIL